MSAESEIVEVSCVGSSVTCLERFDKFRSSSLNRGEALGETFAVDSKSFFQQFSPTY